MSNEPPELPFLRLSEVARILGTTPAVVDRLIAVQAIKTYRICHGVDRIRACDLKDFLDDRKTVVYHTASVKRFDSHLSVH